MELWKRHDVKVLGRGGGGGGHICHIYIFIFCSPDILRTCVSVCFAGECCVYVFQQWYTATMNLLGTWLTERTEQQLHVYQLKILIRITKVDALPPPPASPSLPSNSL